MVISGIWFISGGLWLGIGLLVLGVISSRQDEFITHRQSKKVLRIVLISSKELEVVDR